MELGSRSVRLFATAEAARQHSGRHPGTWCTTFMGLMNAFAGPQTGRDGTVLRSIDLMSTRFVVRSLKAPQGPLHTDSIGHFSQIRALGRALMQLRAAGVTAQHYRQLAQPSPQATELFEALGQYEEALEQRCLADTADTQRGALLRAATGVWPGMLKGLATVTVEPGVEVFDLRRDLLRVLAAKGVRVLVQLPYNVKDPAQTPWAEAMLHGFEAQGQGAIQFEFVGFGSSGPVAAVARRMEEPEQAPPPPGAVVFTSVPAQDALVCHVLRTVRAWFQGGVALHDMAVVLPPSGAFVGSMRPERLGPTLVRALGEAGVPCHTLSGAPLIEHTHGRRLLGVLQLAGQLAALKAPTAGHLFDEAGINVALWAGGVQWSGEVTDCEAGPLAALAQANLLRRCGHRRLGPYALRRALRALRNVPAAVAEATAAAAEAWLARWVLPLCGGDRPLGERVRHLGQLLAHVTERSDGPEALDVMPVAQALQALADSGDAFGIHTSLTEAYGWVSGVLAEQRGRRHQTGPIGGVPILAAQDMVGRRFSHVLALGLNNVPYGPTTGPLSEVLRKEINQALGYKLLQYGAVTGRAPLPLGAQAQFYFTELLRSTQTHLHGVIVKLADEELSAPSQEAERLLRAAAVVPVDVPDGARGPWYQEQTPALALRRLVSSEGLPWALEQAPDDARLRALARGAQMLGPSAQGPRPPLSLATTAQLQGGMIGQVHGVSSLDQLAMCRYRYFAGPLLGLSHEPHPEHHIDRRRAGEAAHRALYQIYSALLAQRPWPHWQAHPDAAQRLAHQTFAAQQAVILPATWVHDDLRQGALAVVWHSVAAQLRRDLAQSVGEPAALEYRFGDPVRTDHPALKVQHPQDPTRHLFVRGTIDRVDRDPARLHVIDYKSTLPSRQPDRHFQLGLYQAVAVRDLLPQAERIEATWLLLGQPASGPVQRQPKELSGSPADVLGQTFAALWARLDAVLAGTVAPDPAPAAVCSHCDFIKLCRYRPETDAQLDLDALDGAEGAA